MKKIVALIAVAFLSLGVAACSPGQIIGPIIDGTGIVKPIDNPVKPSHVFALRLTYKTAFLDNAVRYRELGICKKGQDFTIQNPCAELSVLRQLQEADAKAKVALDTLENVVRNYPTLNATAYLDAAQQAVNVAKAILPQGFKGG